MSSTAAVPSAAAGAFCSASSSGDEVSTDDDSSPAGSLVTSTVDFFTATADRNERVLGINLADIRERSCLDFLTASRKSFLDFSKVGDDLS
jgi:hypothetical protein